jgi:DNA gyrase subunit A
MDTLEADSEEAKNSFLITTLENGFGKRTLILKNFPQQKRGGYGVIASRNSEKTGRVVEALVTSNANQDIILASKSGQIIRIPIKSVKLLGRDTQGVRLMRLEKDDKVASVTIIAQAPTQAPSSSEPEPPKTTELDINYYNGRK